MEHNAGKYIIAFGVIIVIVGVIIYFFGDKLHWLGPSSGGYQDRKRKFPLLLPHNHNDSV